MEGEQVIPGIVRLHGPYEDLGIAACELFGKIVDGQDANTKKVLWDRFLEFSGPIHNAAVEAAKNIEKFFKVR